MCGNKKITIKSPFFTSLALITIVFLTACATSPANQDNASAVAGIVSFDEAVVNITTMVEGRSERGSEIAIAKIAAPLPQIGDFLYDELISGFSASGNLVVLARGRDMESLDSEHRFQMSGLVDDESAVGIGYYLDAKVMIIVGFNRFNNFSQLSIRALDVETGVVLAASRPRIRNDDPRSGGCDSAHSEYQKRCGCGTGAGSAQPRKRLFRGRHG